MGGGCYRVIPALTLAALLCCHCRGEDEGPAGVQRHGPLFSKVALQGAPTFDPTHPDLNPSPRSNQEFNVRPETSRGKPLPHVARGQKDKPSRVVYEGVCYAFCGGGGGGGGGPCGSHGGYKGCCSKDGTKVGGRNACKCDMGACAGLSEADQQAKGDDDGEYGGGPAGPGDIDHFNGAGENGGGVR